MIQSAVDVELPGAFGELPARLRAYPGPGGNEVVVNLHGSYGNLEGSSGKYRAFAERVAGCAHVVLCETSRLRAPRGAFEAGSFAEKAAHFEGKTYADELTDARNLVRAVIAGAPTWFDVAPGELRLTLNGNSLGGFLGLQLAHELPCVRRLCAAGVGLREEVTAGNTLVQGMPSNDELAAMLGAFSGELLAAWGSEDDIFSRAQARRYFEAAAAERRHWLEYPGADHAFRAYQGTPTEALYRDYAECLCGLLRGEPRPEEETRTPALLGSAGV